MISMMKHQIFLYQDKFFVEVIFKTLFLQLNSLNPLSANPTKWSSTLNQFVGNLPTNCLYVFDYFVKLALKGLRTLLCRTSSG